MGGSVDGANVERIVGEGDSVGGGSGHHSKDAASTVVWLKLKS